MKKFDQLVELVMDKCWKGYQQRKGRRADDWSWCIWGKDDECDQTIALELRRGNSSTINCYARQFDQARKSNHRDQLESPSKVGSDNRRQGFNDGSVSLWRSLIRSTSKRHTRKNVRESPYANLEPRVRQRTCRQMKTSIVADKFMMKKEIELTFI